jgi:hypothetical protein
MECLSINSRSDTYWESKDEHHCANLKDLDE